jgi:hypothetical protein
MKLANCFGHLESIVGFSINKYIIEPKNIAKGNIVSESIIKDCE